MEIQEIEVKPHVIRGVRLAERAANRVIRARDRVRKSTGLGGRKANYDDGRYEFVGGPAETIRKRHYDKSLRLLWKAEEHASFLDFRDCTAAERSLLSQALESMSDEEKEELGKLAMPEFKAQLNRNYSPRQKQAIVNVLTAIGHGEAYAWLVSAELLGEVESTGARAALTMQVLEEAKHFVVLRQFLQAFEVPIPRQSAWEYLFLEGVYKADGLEKFFGMNVAVEGIALSLFGLFGDWPGLDLLRLFHLDESRHTALPHNYFNEFPMTEWQKHSPVARWRRLKMILPALMLIVHLEEDLGVLGIDAFDFGGSVLRKVTFLAERSGFYLAVPSKALLPLLNEAFNAYCALTREGHEHQSFLDSESTVGHRELAVEAAIFAAVV